MFCSPSAMPHRSTKVCSTRVSLTVTNFPTIHSLSFPFAIRMTFTRITLSPKEPSYSQTSGKQISKISPLDFANSSQHLILLSGNPRREKIIRAMNRDPSIFPDFDTFRPERFLDDSETKDVLPPDTHNQVSLHPLPFFEQNSLMPSSGETLRATSPTVSVAESAPARSSPTTPSS